MSVYAAEAAEIRKQTITKLEALTATIEALEKLSDRERLLVLAAASTFYGIETVVQWSALSEGRK